MSQTPLLSIVAAVYNGEKFLAQFFECIEQQQLESYELILVNDGSTDNSLAVIDEWKRAYSILSCWSRKTRASRSRVIPASPPQRASTCLSGYRR
jgi:glycosyltransferase involved in cell wall biosynthesis